MPAHLLDEQQAARLRATPLSFTRAWAAGDVPADFAQLSRSVALTGRDFEGAARDLFEWQMHCRAGLRVQASDIPLRQGTVALMRWGSGPLSLRIPCRVLDVIDEPDRRGFAYGTLVGHPEAGEEWFVVERIAGGGVRFTITAYSRPASTLAKLGGPITRAAQLFMTHQYLRALDGSWKPQT